MTTIRSPFSWRVRPPTPTALRPRLQEVEQILYQGGHDDDLRERRPGDDVPVTLRRVGGRCRRLSMRSTTEPTP